MNFLVQIPSDSFSESNKTVRGPYEVGFPLSVGQNFGNDYNAENRQHFPRK